MERLKERIQKMLTPREHTDLQSEILNVILGPLYVYTITTVYYYSLFEVMPYHYGNAGGGAHAGLANDSEEAVIEIGYTSLFFHRCLLTMIYFQMMSNWLCIRFVDSSLQTSSNQLSTFVKDDAITNLSSVVCSNTFPRSSINNVPNRNGHTIPDPASAPPIPAKKSYWSWKFCRKCNLNAPPRCHHCPLCSTCIIKRDHHCFFSGKCVGFYNQRHFIVFLVWASFGTSYSTLHFLPYLFRVFIPKLSSAFEIFPPFALLWWVFGNGSSTTTNMLFSFLFNALFVLLSSGFLYDQYVLVNIGMTQFEQRSLNKNRLNIVDPRAFGDKIRAVMGYNYAWSFIFPLAHWLFKPHENPFEWPEHKVYRGHIS